LVLKAATRQVLQGLYLYICQEEELIIKVKARQELFIQAKTRQDFSSQSLEDFQVLFKTVLEEPRDED